MVSDLRIMAMMTSDEAGSSLRSALSNINGLNLEIESDSVQSVAPRLLNGSAPNILLVDLSLVDADGLTELSQVIARKQGQMAVIATAKEANVETVRSLMRIGFADFVPQPFNKQDLINAVAMARTKIESAHHAGGGVLSFISSGGGVGSTTLAIQTAADLLVKDKKGRNKVCLIDFDLQFGNIALSMDLQSEVGLRQIVENAERLDDEFMAGAIAHHPSGIDVLGAPSEILPLEIMTSELAQNIVIFARRHYDYVVVDMPTNWTSWTSSVLHESDMILMVTDISVTGVQRCQRQLNLLAEQQLDDVPLAIIANKVKSGFGFGNIAKQAESALGRKINCLVRTDQDTACAARDQGVLLQDIKSGSRIVKDLHTFLVKVRPALLAARDARVKQVAAI
jgi:pilus assembly protein CpaE